MAWRISAPAPLDSTSGTTPMMKAKLVIRIGRRRRRQASSTAARRSMPSSCLSLANSTSRMAFLQARPTSTIRPIWVKTLLSLPARITPARRFRQAGGLLHACVLVPADYLYGREAVHPDQARRHDQAYLGKQVVVAAGQDPPAGREHHRHRTDQAHRHGQAQPQTEAPD